MTSATDTMLDTSVLSVSVMLCLYVSCLRVRDRVFLAAGHAPYSLCLCLSLCLFLRDRVSLAAGEAPYYSCLCLSVCVRDRVSLAAGDAPYSVRRVAQIQAELMKNGPTEATFTVYADFPTYKSGKRLEPQTPHYTRGTGTPNPAFHTGKLEPKTPPST